MNELLTTIIIVSLISIFGPGAVIVILILMNPEKVEKWGALVGYTLSKFGGIFKSAHKKAVQLDLQGHINDYVKQVSKDVPTLESQKIKVEFVDENISRKSVLDDGTVILRLRRNDPQELNFVHGAYLFVSTSLLYRVKRYISQSQRDALDLFVTTQLIEKQKKPAVVDYFLDEYLHPNLQDTKSDRSTYYEQLSIINQGGLFYPVLLEELHFLGSKVFGNRQDDRIIIEVSGLLGFLQKVSQRVVGKENVDLNFRRDYCKSAILIVGKKLKLLKHDKIPYVTYIKENLHKNKIETIYVLGSWENKKVIDEMCSDVADIYTTVRSRKIKCLLNFDDGTKEVVDTCAVVLQQISTPIYQPSSI